MTKLTAGWAFFLNLIACPLALADDSYLIRLTNTETLYYQGMLNQAGYQEFKAKLSPAIRQLVIKSEGGNAGIGLKMAALIQQHQLHLVVRDYCLSSCFNYVFLAGTEKSLLPDSLLGYHGFPYPTSEASNPDQASAPAPDWTTLTVENPSQIANAGYEFLRSLKIHTDLPVQLQQRLELAFPQQAKLSRVAQLTLDGKIYSHAADETLPAWFAGLYQQQVKKRKAQGKSGKVPFALTIEDPFSQQVYFPSQAELETLGVSGIRDYPYPVNAADFKGFITQFKKQHQLEKIGIAGADLTSGSSAGIVSAAP